MYMAKKFTMDQAIEAITATGNMVMDNHNDHVTKIAGIGQLRNGDFFPIFDSRYFSVNQLYLSLKDEYRISTCSIGGVVKPMDYNGDIAKAIEAYNTDCQHYCDWLDEKYPDEAPHKHETAIVEYKLF